MRDHLETAITCTVLIGDRVPCGMRGVVTTYGPMPFHACDHHYLCDRCELRRMQRLDDIDARRPPPYQETL